MSRSSPQHPQPVAPSATLFDRGFADETSRHHRAGPDGPDHGGPESGVIACLNFPIPTFLRSETLFRIHELFEEELGSELECRRAIAALGGSRDTVPRRLAGPLLVTLSRKLHPERRPGFLRDACRVLSDYEGTPRLLA